MAWYIEDKNGVRKKISGTSIDAGLKEVPIASETIVGGVISSTNSGSLSVNQSTGEAKINDNLIIAGGGQVVLEGDFGEPPYTITIDKNPPSASQTGYNNSTSGLSATNVQNAIDEIVQNNNEQENKIVTNTLNITNLKDKTTYYSNKNLLDNWYFINPINQRGQTEYITNGYSIDRWVKNTSGLSENYIVTLENGYLRLNNSTSTITSVIRQFFEELPDETYTVSALFINGGVTYLISGQIIWTNSPDTSIGIPWYHDVYLRIGNALASRSNPEFSIFIKAGATVDLIAAKLELGTQQTLAHQDSSGHWVLNDTPPNPAEELLKCQRYFYRTILDSNGYSIIGIGQATNGNIVITDFYLPTIMRIKPSISINMGIKFACFNHKNETWSSTTHNITSIAVDQFHGNYVSLYLSAPGLEAGLNYLYQMNGGYIDFSADL